MRSKLLLVIFLSIALGVMVVGCGQDTPEPAPTPTEVAATQAPTETATQAPTEVPTQPPAAAQAFNDESSEVALPKFRAPDNEKAGDMETCCPLFLCWMVGFRTLKSRYLSHFLILRIILLI